MTNATSGFLDQLYTRKHLQEFAKCALNPDYFIETYCFINAFDEGSIPFSLYTSQKKLLDFRKKNDHILLLGSRQVGISIVQIAMSLHELLFTSSNLIWFSRREQISRRACSQLKEMYWKLPDWLKVPATRMNGNEIHLENGSSFLSTSSNGVCGMSPDSLFVADAQFIPEEMWDSVITLLNYPTTRVIVSATGLTTSDADSSEVISPAFKNFIPSVFKNLLRTADTPNSLFKKFLIHWSDIPSRDSLWKSRIICQIGKEAFDKEYGDLA